MKFNFQNFKSELLSPGNIFWKKISGAITRVSKKGEALNLELLKKLDDANAELLIEDEIDSYAHNELIGLYEKYCSEVLMRDKIIWREKIISHLKKEFITKKTSQFELDFLAIKLFSPMKNEEIKSYMDKDMGLFRRHLSVATSYTLGAFLLGYYEASFLSKLFDTTLKNLMDLGPSAQVLTLKEKLEYLRMQESFDVNDYEFVKDIASSDILSKTVMFEKYDGSGPRHLNSKEMSDLEVVFVAVSSRFGFLEKDYDNILSSIHSGDFKCEKRVLKMLQNILLKEDSTNKNASA